MKLLAEWQARRDALVWAMRSRPVTDREMAEFEQQGYSILTRSGQFYSEDQVMREYNDILLQQYRLRAVAQASAQKQP